MSDKGENMSECKDVKTVDAMDIRTGEAAEVKTLEQPRPDRMGAALDMVNKAHYRYLARTFHAPDVLVLDVKFAWELMEPATGAEGPVRLCGADMDGKINNCHVKITHNPPCDAMYMSRKEYEEWQASFEEKDRSPLPPERSMDELEDKLLQAHVSHQNEVAEICREFVRDLCGALPFRTDVMNSEDCGDLDWLRGRYRCDPREPGVKEDMGIVVDDCLCELKRVQSMRYEMDTDTPGVNRALLDAVQEAVRAITAEAKAWGADHVWCPAIGVKTEDYMTSLFVYSYMARAHWRVYGPCMGCIEADIITKKETVWTKR